MNASFIDGVSGRESLKFLSKVCFSKEQSPNQVGKLIVYRSTKCFYYNFKILSFEFP